MKLEEVKTETFASSINVAQLLKEPVGSIRSYYADEFVAKQVKDYIEGKVDLIRTSQGILVRGKLTVTVEVVCCRCLNSFSLPMRLDIEEEFLPSIDIYSGLPLSSPKEWAEHTIDAKHILDLGEVIRQYILLNLPIKLLCRPDCTGIKEITLYGST